MSEKEEKKTADQIVAEQLSVELGSDFATKAKAVVDRRLMAVLEPPIQAALGYFQYRALQHGVRFWGHVVEWELASSPAVKGLARRQVIQAIAASKGSVGKEIYDIAKKPGWIARHITNRGWKEQAESEGKIVEE
ncbi:MAG: hypothetical protein ACUVT9_05475 [Candidatus Bathycorpusculaceae bacterium]